MTPHIQQIALAELAGYYVEHDPLREHYPWRLMGPSGTQQGSWWMSEEGAWSHGLADYTSLDTLYALRQHLYAHHGYSNLRYSRELSIAMHHRPAWVSFDATPTEHAEAILRMTGKWVES